MDGKVWYTVITLTNTVMLTGMFGIIYNKI